MPNPSRHGCPVTWSDLVHINDTHGIRPDPTRTTKVHKHSRVLHEVYATWEANEHMTPGRGYLMPVHLLVGHVRQHLRATGVHLDTDGVRAFIVNALNHPRSGLEIQTRPYRFRAA